MKHLLEAICKTGSYLGTECEWCGREHFCNFIEDMDKEDEDCLKEYRKKAEQQPDKYIPHDEAISYGYFEGKRTVWGCPCNDENLAKYVRHYWSHAEILAEFLQRKSKEEANAYKVRIAILESIESKSDQAIKNIRETY
uniref:Uncharacterized protein n=1 Tax=viral metagenome TaxID=1070528 RepID=A0A6M3JVK4_9ZZZZ